MSTVPPCGCVRPGAADPETCYCSVDSLLQVIRKRYSLAVMRAVHAHSSARYHEIAEAVTDASSSTLAETLRTLEAAHLLRRDIDAASHPLYSLTRSGEKLLNRLRRLLEDVQAS